MFLLSLSVLVLSSTRQGWLSIIHKDDRAPLRTPIHNILLLGLVAVGVTLGVYGLNSGSILFMILGVLQIAIGVSSLRYNCKEGASTQRVVDRAPARPYWIRHWCLPCIFRIRWTSHFRGAFSRCCGRCQYSIVGCSRGGGPDFRRLSQSALSQ